MEIENIFDSKNEIIGNYVERANAYIEALRKKGTLPKIEELIPRFAEFTEGEGWKKSIAGDDFDLAMKEIAKAFINHRCLLFIGASGVGKSLLMKIMYKTDKRNNRFWFDCIDEGQMQDLHENQKYYFNKNIYLDDLGSENIKNEYGTKINIIEEFICKFYNYGKGTIIANSNLQVEQLLKEYGQRCLDRIKEMFVIVKFNGKSKRMAI